MEPGPFDRAATSLATRRAVPAALDSVREASAHARYGRPRGARLHAHLRALVLALLSRGAAARPCDPRLPRARARAPRHPPHCRDSPDCGAAAPTRRWLAGSGRRGGWDRALRHGDPPVAPHARLLPPPRAVTPWRAVLLGPARSGAGARSMPPRRRHAAMDPDRRIRGPRAAAEPSRVRKKRLQEGD